MRSLIRNVAWRGAPSTERLLKYPRMGIIVSLRCDASWQPTRNRSIGSAPRFEKAANVLHAFHKKSPSAIRTAKRGVDLVAERLKTAERDDEEHDGKPKR